MPLDLSKRVWPDRDFSLREKPEGGQMVGSARRTFVSEGGLVVRGIDFNGLMAPPPRNSSLITALALGDNLVYGATSGEQSWLFQYAFTPYCDAAIPLGPIPNTCRVRQSLVIGERHSALGAGYDGTESRLFRATGIALPGDVIQEWSLPLPHYEALEVPVPGEEVILMRASRLSGLVYGLASPSGTVFSYDPDQAVLERYGELDPVRFFSPLLVEDDAGYWYGFGTTGRVLRLDPATRALERTGWQVPCFPGRGPYARISAAVCAGGGRLLLGDTEGLVSLLDLESGEVTPLGKPIALGGIDHLVRVPDGRLYGTAGSREGMAHLFVYDPARGSLRDLGVMCATLERACYGYRIGAMVATPAGRLILGEEDHLGALFSYFPPLRG